MASDRKTDVLYIKIPNSESFIKSLKEIKESIKKVREIGNSLQTSIGRKSRLLRISIVKYYPSLEKNLKHVRDNLPLDEDDIKTIKEKLERKEEVEKPSEEKIKEKVKKKKMVLMEV